MHGAAAFAYGLSNSRSKPSSTNDDRFASAPEPSATISTEQALPLWSEHSEGDEGILWRRRADAEESARAIELLIEQEADRRVAIWLRVRLGGERMTTVAAEYGYRDGSGVHRVIKRFEEKQKAIDPCRAL